MTGTESRMLPSELKIRPTTLSDQHLVEEIFSDERLAAMGDTAFPQGYEQAREQLLALMEQGVMKGWFVELPGFGVLSAQFYAPSGFEGTWSGDTVTAPGVETLGRRGIGTACMALALDALFADESVHRLAGQVAVINPAALAMCDRMGFQREGLARSHMATPAGKRVDAVMVGLLRSEWAGAAAVEQRLLAES
ncbi:GNAT family N-acetyltransferase [Streptomyces alfalfae]|uniref:GNAT family N-acetyltransferase n=2 Tax=Streptomyces alfalfae TaxID=1642299 RepID=A0A7T4U093_9ACTN|nr:GNAT family protein [Streptomyces alfalfae]QQC92089.1 GNAT family N-acetyltransferase [Streptomyces alfalfae]